MTLVAAAKAAGNSPLASSVPAWLWTLLQGPVGAALTRVDSDSLANEAHAICMTQVGSLKGDKNFKYQLTLTTVMLWSEGIC